MKTGVGDRKLEQWNYDMALSEGWWQEAHQKEPTSELIGDEWCVQDNGSLFTHLN